MDLALKQQKQIEAAVEAARFMAAQKPVKAVADRIKAVRPHLKTYVQELCRADGCDSFSDDQIEVLSELIMYIVVMNEPLLQDKPSFWGDFRKLTPIKKIGNIALLITIILGSFQILEQTVNGGSWVLNTVATGAVEDAVEAKPEVPLVPKNE